MCLTLSALKIRNSWVIGALSALVLGLVLTPRTARAWMVGSPLDETGCHESITAAALRAVRARFDTAPVIAPSRDEAAMIADVEFAPPGDFVHDLAGMTLLLGARDNDLKGIDPLSSLDLFEVQADPETQNEHCNRGPDDDGDAGDQNALAACRAFIVNTATDALDGLDAAGRVDPTRRTAFKLFLAIRGEITPSLPLFYLKIGEAMHTLEDSFPHTYRTADGMKVTVVLNGIDLHDHNYDEARDGPGHRGELDRCWDATDPIIHRNYELAIQATTELLAAALDSGLSREQKRQQFDAVTAKYLGYQPGCTFANQWCDPPEAHVTNSLATCNASGSRSPAPWSALVLVGLVVRRRRSCRGSRSPGRILRVLDRARSRSRRWAVAISCAVIVTAGFAAATRADDSAAPAAPSLPIEAAAPTLPAANAADTQLGSRWGFAGSLGGSIDRGGLVGSLGGRYRVDKDEDWLVGLDASWNPWITPSPREMYAGVATVAGTLIWRPLRFGRWRVRSTLHLGASMLLFDVYGAPMYSTGLYGAISPLGLEYDLGHGVRFVADPMEVALPVPLLAGPPLYYEQFRFVIGIQIGA